MAEDIKLASFDIDVDAVVKSAAELRKEIKRLKEEQEELSEEGMVQNEAALKALNSEYRKHIKVIQETIEDTAKQANREELLNAALNQEALTINDLRAQNKILNQLRNETNLLTDEGQAELVLLNEQLDKNNELIKVNVDSLSQQKINVGNYSDSIKDALGGMLPMNQSITQYITNINEAGGASKFFAGGIKQATTAMAGLTKAALSFLATPIGAVIGALGAAFLLVRNAMNRSEESTNKIRRSFAAVTGVVQAVLKALEPLGEYLIDGIVWAFDKATEAATKFRQAGADFLDFVGFKGAAQNLRDLDRAINEAIEGEERLADAEAELEKAQRQSALTQKQFQIQAEDLRQIRDNENLTIRERIKANEDLGAVLQQQLESEKALAMQALVVAQLRLQQEGETKENLDAQSEALLQIYDIQERINGQESEQLTNRVALQKEAADLAIQQQKEALELFLAEQGVRAKTLQEELDLEREASEQRIEILKSELAAKKISQDGYAAAVLEIQNDLIRRQAEITADNAMREVEERRRMFERQREDAMFLSKALAEQRKAENNQLLADEKALADQRLALGLINQQERDDAIRELTEANRLANKELDKQREDIERQEAEELLALEFQDRMRKLEAQRNTEFEQQQAHLAEQRRVQEAALEEQRRQGLISEEIYQARLANIQAEYEHNSAQARLQMEEALANQKLDLTANVLGAIGALVDESSSFGKSLAIAEALINTYQGITAALKAPWPLSIPAVATAALTGFKAVKDIMKTKLPSSSGGTITGGESQGSSLGADLQLAGNQSNLTAVAASGNAAVQDQIQRNADQANMAQDVSAAVREGARQGTEAGSEQGLTNLSDNRAIQNVSTF